MKSIRFVFVGKAKNPHFRSLEEFYLERIRHHHCDAMVQTIKDAATGNRQVDLVKESETILECLSKRDLVIVCDERGKPHDSKKFSNRLQNWMDTAQRVNFVVGGAFGFSEAVRARADQMIRLSDFTLPHELARVVLLEQVYRGLSILAGTGYHHC